MPLTMGQAGAGRVAATPGPSDGDRPTMATVADPEPGPTHPSPEATHDLPRLARAGRGRKPAWARQSDDLSVNLISCLAGEGIAAHVNGEVDVLLVGVEGEGSVAIEGRWYPLPPGRIALVPKGARRATRCDGEHFAYLTCHRRRSGLWPAPRTAGGDDRTDDDGGRA